MGKPEHCIDVLDIGRMFKTLSLSIGVTTGADTDDAVSYANTNHHQEFELDH